MKYSISRFLFLLFIFGFVCCVSEEIVPAMMSSRNDYEGENGSNSYGNDPYNNGNNGMMGNGGDDMRSQVRSIVDNILQLNQRSNNESWNGNGNYDNNNAPYGNYNRYQQNGNDSYQSQQSQHQNNNEQNKNNEAIALADNREVNQKIEKAINELNTLKKNVNRRFSQIQPQQRNGRDGHQNNTNAKDKKTGKYSKKSVPAEKKGEKKSNRWKSYHKSKGKCNKQIFTVKNVDTCNMRTNSYLSLKSKYGSKYHVNNHDYSTKNYSPTSNGKSRTTGHITYTIKSYSKNDYEKKNTELAALDTKKYTVKNHSYFSYRNGCKKNKCG